MSLKLVTDSVYERARRVAPYFDSEFRSVEVPAGMEWITAWDIAILAVTWEYHLGNGARIGPSMIDGTLDRNTGRITLLTDRQTQDLLTVFERVRQNDEIRRDLRHLVRASR